MKKTNTYEDYEQLTIDFGDEVPAAAEEPKPTKKTKQKRLEVGVEVAVNPEATHFCDGRGIPDYARRAFIKRYNPNETVLLETAPGGKELGLLFAKEVSLV